MRRQDEHVGRVVGSLQGVADEIAGHVHYGSNAQLLHALADGRFLRPEAAEGQPEGPFPMKQGRRLEQVKDSLLAHEAADEEDARFGGRAAIAGRHVRLTFGRPGRRGRNEGVLDNFYVRVRREAPPCLGLFAGEHEEHVGAAHQGSRHGLVHRAACRLQPVRLAAVKMQHADHVEVPGSQHQGRITQQRRPVVRRAHEQGVVATACQRPPHAPQVGEATP